MKTISAMRRQAGLAILDILVWAGGIILAIAIIGALAFLVTGSGSAVNYSTGITALKKCVVDLSYGTGGTAAETTVAAANCVPPSWTDGTDILTPDDQTAAAVVIANTGATPPHRITIINIPQEACVQMIPGMASGFDNITVDGQNVWDGTNVNTATLVAECDGAAAVVFDFAS